MNIGLVYDLRSDYLAEGFSEEDAAEFDSDATIAAIEEALRSLGHLPERIGHGRALCRRLVAGDRWDLVFNIAEGVRGRCREAQVPALLELYGIPYTMSDPLACAATLDKVVAKRLVREAGLLTPRFAVVETPADVASVRLYPPLFAKPLAEGTGVGIDRRSRIANRAGLRAVCECLLDRFREPVLVEEYLPGREFTTGLIGTGADARVIGTMEVLIRAEAGPVDYSYEMKEYCEYWVDYATPEPGPLRDAVERLALDAYRVLQCRDTARADVRLDAQGRPSFMEINPLPGLHPTHSDLPMIATRAGWTYPKLIGAIVHSARRRYGLA